MRLVFSIDLVTVEYAELGVPPRGRVSAWHKTAIEFLIVESSFLEKVDYRQGLVRQRRGDLLQGLS